MTMSKRQTKSVSVRGGLPLCEKSQKLVRSLMKTVESEAIADPELTSSMVMVSLTRLLVRETVRYRNTQLSDFDIASELGGFVFGEYMAMHRSVIEEEAKDQPAG